MCLSLTHNFSGCWNDEGGGGGGSCPKCSLRCSSRSLGNFMNVLNLTSVCVVFF